MAKKRYTDEIAVTFTHLQGISLRTFKEMVTEGPKAECRGDFDCMGFNQMLETISDEINDDLLIVIQEIMDAIGYDPEKVMKIEDSDSMECVLDQIAGEYMGTRNTNVKEIMETFIETYLYNALSRWFKEKLVDWTEAQLG